MTTNQIHVYVRKLTNASWKKDRKNLFYSQWKHATWPKLVSLLLIILGEGTVCYNNAACIIGTYNLPFLLAVSNIYVSDIGKVFILSVIIN